ncbi:MAG TPA: cobalamin B12-binding domain-containing protein [Syntrophales bacterium]|nr:cobalamin B12-binding domain-containing protein [Syntrophales bacterium]
MATTKRVVIARLGSDDRWRGIITITRALRDAGMEVIYLGDQLPESIVQSAIQEDADVVGLSSLSGNHMVLSSTVIRLLREKGAGDIPVIIGGKIPPDDVASLKEVGVLEVFTPGTPIETVISFIADIEKK